MFTVVWVCESLRGGCGVTEMNSHEIGTRKFIVIIIIIIIIIINYNNNNNNNKIGVTGTISK
jgi:hypothetical protein